MEVAELQSMITRTRSERGFTTDPLRVMTLLVEEVGEVAGELKKTWSANYDDLRTEDLANELAEVLVLVSALASSFDIDLETAVQNKFRNADGQRNWATASPSNPPEQLPD